MTDQIENCDICNKMYFPDLLQRFKSDSPILTSFNLCIPCTLRTKEKMIHLSDNKGYSPYCKNCNHSESWHYANIEIEKKLVSTCYGKNCNCLERFN
jgi:hypothetical protein